MSNFMSSFTGHFRWHTLLWGEKEQTINPTGKKKVLFPNIPAACDTKKMFIAWDLGSFKNFLYLIYASYNYCFNLGQLFCFLLAQFVQQFSMKVQGMVISHLPLLGSCHSASFCFPHPILCSCSRAIKWAIRSPTAPQDALLPALSTQSRGRAQVPWHIDTPPLTSHLAANQSCTGKKWYYSSVHDCI